MRSRPKRRSASSPGSSPLVFEIRPSRRARAAVLGFATIAGVALMLAPEPAFLWRVLSAALSLGLGGPPVANFIFNRGRRAVRRVVWRSDGTWSITSGGREFDVQLMPATSILGGFIVLAWRNPILGRRYALVEARCIGQATFRCLKGRLRVEKG
jgi:hypothetical protein